AGIIGHIQSEYEKLFSGNPFEYFFLDEYFNRQYQTDQRFGQIFGVFAGLAIIIAVLGLFALSAFSAVKRTKEIGIRKVLGATTPNLVMLLSKDFLLLLSLANLVALPLAGLIIKKWLENYAFRINLGWDIFVIPAVIVAAIALITVSTQAIKAALANPVEALRYE
ncbi:MAG: ABC transporter permease, partial [bacterium]